MRRLRQRPVTRAFRRVAWLTPVAVAVLLISIACASISTADERLLDILFRLRESRLTSSSVVVVAIDDDSLSRSGLRWPWPRDVYVDLLNRLADAGAAVCGFDLLFIEEDDSDVEFAHAFRHSGVPVVLASKFELEERDEYRSTRYLLPAPILEESAAGFGYANLPIDTDGVIRRIPSWRAFNGIAAESFWESVVSAYTSQSEIEYPAGGRINYVGGPGSVETVSFYQIMEGLIPSERLSGKVVLVGLTSEDLGDRHLTPYSSEGMMAGVEVHANIIDMVLASAYLTEVPGIARILIHTLFGVAVALGVALSPGWSGPFVCAVLMLGYLFISVALIERSIVVSVLPALLMCVLIPSIVYVLRYLKAERERRHLGEVFSKYVPHDLVDEMLESGDGASSPRRCDASVLFCDLRQFTSIAARLSPEETVAFLNSFFQQAADSVAVNRGLIMKFLGDGFMAVFGAGSPDQNHAQHAVEAAMEITESVRSISVQGLDRDEVVRAGVGVHSGEVAIGDVGSARQMDHTVVGDTVNTASRLEGLTRRFGVDVVISAETHARLAAELKMRFRPVSGVKVRGLPERLTVFALVEKGEGLDEESRRKDRTTQSGVSL